MYIFWYCSHVLVNLILQSSDNFFSIKKVSLCCVLNNFQYHFHATTPSMICLKTLYPDLPIFCLVYDHTNPKVLKFIGDCNAFLVPQRNNPGAFAVNINNRCKNLTLSLYLLTNCMSARSNTNFALRYIFTVSYFYYFCILSLFFYKCSLSTICKSWLFQMHFQHDFICCIHFFIFPELNISQ